MSIVTNIIICGNSCTKNLERINEWLDIEYHAPINKINEYAGGEKHLETSVLVGAFDCLKINDFIEFLKSLDWHDGKDEKQDEEIYMFIREQELDGFSMIRIH